MRCDKALLKDTEEITDPIIEYMQVNTGQEQETNRTLLLGK